MKILLKPYLTGFLSGLSLTLIGVLLFCWLHADKWTAFAQPDPQSKPLALYTLGSFENLSECQEAETSLLTLISSAPLAKFRCGSNCEYKAELGSFICENFVDRKSP